MLCYLCIHACSYALPSDNYREFERMEKQKYGWGFGLEETETYYTIHLWDSRRVTWNYILFLVDYGNYRRMKTAPTPIKILNHSSLRKQWLVTESSIFLNNTFIITYKIIFCFIRSKKQKCIPHICYWNKIRYNWKIWTDINK